MGWRLNFLPSFFPVLYFLCSKGKCNLQRDQPLCPVRVAKVGEDTSGTGWGYTAVFRLWLLIFHMGLGIAL